MADVFISYARQDRDRARLVAHGLTAEGFSVWWDPDIKPGKKWNDVIRRALADAAVVVTLWTPRSVSSAWVLGETTDAHNRKVLAPAMLRRCDPPIPFNMIQSADLTHWRGNGDDPDWTLLLERVRALVEAKKQLAAGAPPPGEAEAALRTAGYAYGDIGATYQPAANRGTFGPRWGRILLGGVAAVIAITAGIWAVDAAPGLWTPAAPAPAASSAPDSTPASDAKPESAAPLEASPAPEASPALPASTPAATPAEIRDPRAEGAVDTCASRLVRLCRRPVGATAAIGFTVDRTLSGQEQTFPRGLGLAPYPTSAATVSACTALTGQLNVRTPSLVGACRGVGWSNPNGVPPRRPRGEMVDPNAGDSPGQVGPGIDQAVDWLKNHPPAPREQPPYNNCVNNPNCDG